MTDAVYRWIVQEKLMENGDFVLAGISGGADSICLLLLLIELREKIEFSLSAVHVEHGIRGKESLQDAAFVEEFCKKCGVACRVRHVDAPAASIRAGIGLEEAARALRYECYREVAEQSGAERVKIALAHHADDNAETMLFHLVRGSGIRGLGGIRPRRRLSDGIEVVRPLLAATRSEIERYLLDRGQGFCEDETNWDTDYSRNWIRHEVLPRLKEINSQAIAHMTRSAGMFLELSEYLEAEADQVASHVCRPAPGGREIDQSLFFAYPALLQQEVVLRVLGEIAGSRKDLGSAHVGAVVRLAGLQVGRAVDLPYGMRADRTYEGVRIRRILEAESAESGTYEISLHQLRRAESGGEIKIVLPDGELRLRVLDFPGEMDEIPKKTYTKWLNYDKIKRSLQFRKRAGGEYLIIDGQGHRKRLKEYFIGEKIPREHRDDIWLLAEGAHVIWVVGERIGADYKIEQDTGKILEIQISGGNYRENQKD